jgi:hypothetical protein
VHCCLRRGDRPIKGEPRLDLTFSKHPALTFEGTDVLFGLIEIPQFKFLTALAGIHSPVGFMRRQIMTPTTTTAVKIAASINNPPPAPVPPECVLRSYLAVIP